MRTEWIWPVKFLLVCWLICEQTFSIADHDTRRMGKSLNFLGIQQDFILLLVSVFVHSFIQVVTIIQKLLDRSDRNDNIGNYFAFLAKSLLNTPTSYGKYVLILVVNFVLSISYILFFILYTVHKLRSWSSYYNIFRNQVEILERARYWYHIRFLLNLIVAWIIFNTLLENGGSKGSWDRNMQDYINVKRRAI